MNATPRDALAWGWKYRRAIAIAASIAGTIGTAAIGLVFTMWLNVRDHSATLTDIRAEQVAMRNDDQERRRLVTEEQRERDHALRDWQRDSLNRDREITAELSKMNRNLGDLSGQLKKAAAYQGWRVDPPRVGMRQFEGSVN